MIKVIEKYFCDRCEKEIEVPFKTPSVHIQHFDYTIHNGLSHISNFYKNVQLCPTCANEFLKWFHKQ